MTFKIEKGIPIPPSKGGQPPVRIKYPWAQMEIGDSFVVGIHPPETISGVRKRLRAAGDKWCQKHQPVAMIKTRIEGQDQIRVWKDKREDALELPDDCI